MTSGKGLNTPFQTQMIFLSPSGPCLFKYSQVRQGNHHTSPTSSLLPLEDEWETHKDKNNLISSSRCHLACFRLLSMPAAWPYILRRPQYQLKLLLLWECSQRLQANSFSGPLPLLSPQAMVIFACLSSPSVSPPTSNFLLCHKSCSPSLKKQ